MMRVGQKVMLVGKVVDSFRQKFWVDFGDGVAVQVHRRAVSKQSRSHPTGCKSR